MVDLAGAEEDLDNHRKRDTVFNVLYINKFMVLLSNMHMELFITRMSRV